MPAQTSPYLSATDEKLLLARNFNLASSKELPPPVTHQKKKSLMDKKWLVVGYSTIVMAILFLLVQSLHSCAKFNHGEVKATSQEMPCHQVGHSQANPVVTSIVVQEYNVESYDLSTLLIEEYMMLD